MNVLYFLTPKSEIYYLDNDSTLRQALEKMDYHKFTVIPLIDQDGRYVSTISEGDILRVIKNRCSFNLSMAESIRLSDIERYRPYRCLKVTELRSVGRRSGYFYRDCEKKKCDRILLSAVIESERRKTI